MCSRSIRLRARWLNTGTGEDYESDTKSYELTVRASDGSLHTEVIATVNVTDAPGDNSVSEPDDQDLPMDSSTSGQMAVGKTTAGEIGTSGDVDWFAIELEANQSVVVRMTGFDPETRSYVGGIKKPQIKGIYDSEANLLSDTSTTDPGA